MPKLIAIAFVLTVIGLCAPAHAYSQQDQMACQDDAFRLCGQAIPDERRVRACLIVNKRRLSPACRKLFR